MMSVDSLLCIRINSGKGGDLVVERVRFAYIALFLKSSDD